MNGKWMRNLFVLLSLFVFMRVHAGEPIPLTLEEARRRALQNNPTLAQAKLDESAARWGMLGAVSDALPHVSFNSSVTRFDDDYVYRQNIMRDVILQEYGQYIDPEDFPPFAYKDMYVSSISVDQPIYNGGIEITAIRIARTRKKLIHLYREISARDIVLQAETAYYNLCRAQQAFEVQSNELEVTRGYLERFRRRLELGLIAEVDVLRWEVRESNDLAALVEAENNLKLAQLSLARVMGDPPNESYYPADLPAFLARITLSPGAGIESPDRLWEKMQESSPDLQVSRYNVKLERQNVWLTAANFQPKLNFNYTYSWQADDDLALDGFKSWTAGFSLRIPLFASFGNLARWQEARVKVKRAEEGARDYETALYMQLTATHNDLTAAGLRLEAAMKMREQAQKVLSSQENRYDLGMITTLELLDARTAELTAELGVINAYCDALIARTNLNRITGTLSFDH